MKQHMMIAAGEWRYWFRSHMALAGAGLFVLLLLATSVITSLRIDNENHARSHQQKEAEETFLSQPDRHPHRMVHYGHYVFRNPVPLALFDPGLDSLTGQSIFLEGHRQNSAMFAESSASADFGGLSWLTPALVYQLFAPLLIVLFGHSAIVREREAMVLAPLLAQGVGARTIIFGKAFAILCLVVMLLLPMLFVCFIAIAKGGEAPLAAISLLGAYFAYLLIWALLTLFISTIIQKRTNILATLSAIWLGTSLLMPSILVDIAARKAPLAGKIETDLAMLNDLRKLGDGHNANDPAFTQLRADLLRQYNVERVEDLPINFRGIVAMNSEEKLTEVMNHYADQRMKDEARQAKHLMEFAWLTPTLAIADASRAISGTDLEHYHRFLKEAETLRYDFVQGLNKSHVEKLSYQDDINRNKDEASWQRARVDSANWEVLDSFVFAPADASTRIVRAFHTLTILIAWIIVILGGLFWSARRLKL